MSPFFGVRPAGWITEEPANRARDLLGWAELADELGFEVLFVGERLLSRAGGPELAVYDAPMLEPFVLLSAMAARTTRIRLASLITVIPFRHPVQLAKITASLDTISNGRLIVGAGSGWSDAELRLFDIDRRRRGAQMEEGIALLRRLWSGESVTAEGEFWTLDDICVTPTPVQMPGPPVWLASFAPDDAVTFSGTLSAGQRRSLERIGRIADGWAPLTYSAGHKTQLKPEQLTEGWALIADAAGAVGRDPGAIDILYPHWIEIVDSEEDAQAAREGLARFFPGTYEEARATYLIGTVEEIADRVRAHTAGLPRVDGYLFTSISERPSQLHAIAERLRPLLED